MTSLHWAFWISLTFCLYTFFGYGAMLFVLGKFRRRTRVRQAIEPTVSILIAVRGGEGAIEQKLRNCLALDYPRERLGMVVACDGGSPAIEAIVAALGDPRIRVITTPLRGKSFALGRALETVSSEIVVFTDVGVTLDPSGVREIVSNFADPMVGCVSSEDVTAGSPGNAEPAFISFDLRLRRLESSVRSLINASGSFFAVRRELCRNWDDALSSDFFVPLRCIEAGYEVVTDPHARGYIASVKAEQEFARKVRTIVHGISVLVRHRQLLNPLAHGLVAWELASHKLFRWLLPLGLVSLLFSNMMLWNSGWLYRATLVGQLAILGIGVSALALRPLRRLPLFQSTGFVLLGNLATVQAWWEFLKGERYVSWQPSRR